MNSIMKFWWSDPFFRLIAFLLMTMAAHFFGFLTLQEKSDLLVVGNALFGVAIIFQAKYFIKKYEFQYKRKLVTLKGIFLSRGARLFLWTMVTGFESWAIILATVLLHLIFVPFMTINYSLVLSLFVILVFWWFIIPRLVKQAGKRKIKKINEFSR